MGRLLLKFAIPSTLALIISCLYNIVDQIFVGNGVGYLGSAATGVVFPVAVIGRGPPRPPSGRPGIIDLRLRST